MSNRTGFRSPWAAGPSATFPEGKLVVEELHSPSLEGNALGDPPNRRTPVYLPASYEREPRRRYPVVYWLHGFTGTALSGVSWSPWTPSLPDAMDRAARETGREAILVLVDGFTRFGGSQYVNSSLNGRYEDYVVRDVVTFVDQRYRTIAEPWGRGVAGKSSGGYGAFVLGMRHPETFGGLAAVSGDAYFELCYKTDFPKLLNQIAKHKGVKELLDAFLAAEKKSGDLTAAINIVAMAMAYSPNLENPLGFDLPFDTYTGELLPEVWSRWEAADPVNLANQHAESLRSLRAFYFECGTRDEFHLQYGARILHRRLEQLEVPHEHAEFDYGHMGINFRYHEALGRLLRALEPAS